MCFFLYFLLFFLVIIIVSVCSMTTLMDTTGRPFCRKVQAGEKPVLLHGFSITLTLLWAQIAEPRSFQVPPLLSIRSMRRICRKRRLRREVARTLPWFPTATTGTEAISTKMSGKEDRPWQRTEKVMQKEDPITSTV